MNEMLTLRRDAFSEVAVAQWFRWQRILTASFELSHENVLERLSARSADVGY